MICGLWVHVWQLFAYIMQAGVAFLRILILSFPMHHALYRFVLPLIFATLLANCGLPNPLHLFSNKAKRHAAGGIYKVGNPYQIDGAWYYPRENKAYDRKGIASWYGAEFQGRRTANGEIFNMHLLTAAHPTLPMPVMARVTNLENGRSLVVRINDRGPFKRNREIDLSRRAAEMLGFKKQGTAKVRVQYLRRAALYNANGRLIFGREEKPQRLKKPQTPARERMAGAAPVGPTIERATLDGSPLPNRPQALQKTQFYVQVGVFSRPENAAVLTNKLRSMTDIRGLAALDVSPVQSGGGGEFYRVRFGPIASRDKARQIADKILQHGHQDAFIKME